MLTCLESWVWRGCCWWRKKDLEGEEGHLYRHSGGYEEQNYGQLPSTAAPLDVLTICWHPQNTISGSTSDDDEEESTKPVLFTTHSTKAHIRRFYARREVNNTTICERLHIVEICKTLQPECTMTATNKPHKRALLTVLPQKEAIMKKTAGCDVDGKISTTKDQHCNISFCRFEKKNFWY